MVVLIKCPIPKYYSFLKVTAYLNSYLELRLCQPRIGRLKDLLSECPFRGSEYEGEGEGAEPGEEGWEGESMPVETGGNPRKKKKQTPRKVRD